MLVFSHEPVERLRFVCQTGGNNPKVKWECEGFESIVFASIFFGRLPLTDKGVIHVFGINDNLWRGSIVKKDGNATKVEAGDKPLYFSDFYTKAN